MGDKESQDEEIEAIKSIYTENDLLVYDTDKREGIFYVKISAATTPFELNFVNEKQVLKVTNLTPIVLNFTFPDDYPSKSAPNYTLTCRWLCLDDIAKLCKNLDDLWEKNANSPILFSWIYFLMDESLEFLGLMNKSIDIYTNNELKTQIDKRVIKDSCSIALIRDYDKDEREIKFQNSYHTCNVCFTDKSGFDMMEFVPCYHTYCNECMKGYFEVQIKDGNVNNLTCPFDKCETQGLPLQVFKLVDKELYKKYDSLLLRNSFNSMTDVIYCPRNDCQNPVIPDGNLAQCQVCNYAFCSFCRQGYHGIEPCKINNNEIKKIVEDYKYGDETVRAALVKRFGAKRLAQVLEESSSMELIENTSKQCPHCSIWMQKLDGCNKMTCIKCRSYFCWLCLSQLSKTDPYSHFNAMNSNCFNKLFEGMEMRQHNDDNNDNIIDFAGFDLDDDVGNNNDDGLPADPPPPAALLQQLQQGGGGAQAPVGRLRHNRNNLANAEIDDLNIDQYAFNDDYEDFDDEDYNDDDDFHDGGWDYDDDDDEDDDGIEFR